MPALKGEVEGQAGLFSFVYFYLYSILELVIIFGITGGGIMVFKGVGLILLTQTAWRELKLGLFYTSLVVLIINVHKGLRFCG